MSPASRRERALVAAAFVVLALLRLATLAPDTWEWDEVLFMEGVRDGLDVRVNHPHAPGYPVFIRLGQGIRALGVEPFRATALAGALGGYLSVLTLYLLLRELGSRREWALAGALFYALTPSVWLHGVRPLSDGPGAAAALFAAVFLVRAAAGKGRLSLVWAAAFTAIAAGVRPQMGLALLPAAAVAAALVLRRERRAKPLILAVLAGVLLSAAIWIPVFRSSGGFAVWKDRFDGQMKYVTEFDSPKARDFARPGFWKRWWLDPVGNVKIAAGFLALGLAGAALERRKAGPIFLLFAPVTALTLGVLSTDSAPRYALAFWTAPCALAAFALERFAGSRGGRIAAPAAAVLLLAALAALGVPPVVEVATRPSPSVAVMKALKAEGLAAHDVFVTEVLRAHAGEFFGNEAWV
ncbi:MAG: glycosyltransferase family 39 protein, partial [Thermoanaerobaculia bacterium]